MLPRFTLSHHGPPSACKTPRPRQCNRATKHLTAAADSSAGGTPLRPAGPLDSLDSRSNGVRMTGTSAVDARDHTRLTATDSGAYPVASDHPDPAAPVARREACLGTAPPRRRLLSSSSAASEGTTPAATSRWRVRPEARIEPHAAGSAIAARATACLARERFAEKRMSGSRSPRVARRSRYRPNPSSTRPRLGATAVVLAQGRTGPAQWRQVDDSRERHWVRAHGGLRAGPSDLTRPEIGEKRGRGRLRCADPRSCWRGYCRRRRSRGCDVGGCRASLGVHGAFPASRRGRLTGW